MNHTALPWRAEGIPYDGIDDPCIISNVAKNRYGDDQYIAQTVYDMQSTTTRDEVDADTLFIVEACNSHQALLRVARAAKEHMKSAYADFTVEQEALAEALKALPEGLLEVDK